MGGGQWRFESGDSSSVHPFDSTFFWSVLVGWPLFWTLMVIGAVFGTWSNLPLAACVLGVASANAVGYFKCRKDAKKHLQAWVTSHAVQAATQNPEFATNLAVGGLHTLAGVVTGSNPQQQRPVV
eukprot:NODE_6401_length_513_cov_44.672414_g5626_i0.p1 GENE.NODE_6401_length_513_cov_44.672414_g5626_i0~~NODE_6401_length_513_cov_44.672414_g5626_i0.p1  ORF type:complete len:125 (+),score=35.45 NODE_6401_length_513_cov_44.672414_g5626_i0:33-407(+)